MDIHSWKKNQRFDLHQLIPALSIFAGANLNFSNNPYHFSSTASASPNFILMTQNHLGDGSWVFVTNTIADYLFTKYLHPCIKSKINNNNFLIFMLNIMM